MDSEAVWRSIEAERSDLADLLASLTPEQWETPSLCDGWRVREVAAHLTIAARVGVADVLRGLVRARGSFDAWVDHDARTRAARPTPELVAELRACAAVRRHPPTTTPLDPLVDVLAHGQDI